MLLRRKKYNIKWEQSTISYHSPDTQLKACSDILSSAENGPRGESVVFPTLSLVRAILLTTAVITVAPFEYNSVFRFFSIR